MRIIDNLEKQMTQRKIEDEVNKTKVSRNKAMSSLNKGEILRIKEVYA